MRRCRGGFTLLETLVVLVVLGLILAMLGQGIELGLNAQPRYVTLVAPSAEIVPVQTALRQMIERMDPGRFPDPAPIKGEHRALAFSTELPDPAQGGIIAVDARLERQGEELVLIWTPHGGGVPFAGPPPPHRAVLLDHVTDFTIDYAARFSGPAWRDRWQAETLPGLIRLTVTSRVSRSWPPLLARPMREAAEE